MTSRFGKTYSRKGGNGSSKFDEVVSNKRATLSTKWGETTFKAQVGSKRPNFKPEVTEVPKRVKYTEPETSEDPFGFDSDEDSKPVTSRSIAQTKAPSGKQATETVTYENFTSVLEANSMISQPISKDAVATGRVSAFDAAVHGIKEKSTNKIPEEGNSVFSSYTTEERTPQNWSNESTEKNSYSWYKNATESDKNLSAQTTTLKMDNKDSFDSWQSSAGFRSDSPNPETCKSKESTWTGSTKQGTEANYESKVEESASHLDSDFSLKSQSDQAGGGDIDIPMEPAEAEVVSQSVLRPSNCRTYRRPNKGKQSSPVDNSDKLADSTGQSSAKTNSVAVKPASTGRGRTRDYTVLHPSCLSVCNVTIQDTIERSIDEFTTAAPADLGEAGRLRKKTEIAAAAKPARFRPTQNKSKKAAKLEFFGFDEEHGGQGIEGDPTASGSANYKIKYFGFDDVSESDSDEEEGSQASEKRKAKKKKAAAAAAATAASMTLSSLQLSCMGESDSQDSQTSTNTEHGGQGIEGDPTASGGANYKIKYFGFDDVSESDSDEEEGSQASEKRKAKKKKAAAAAAATAASMTSFRPTQNKSKKAAKLEFFGFDEEHGGQGIEGDPTASGSANYKIKYFGFDDVSESDSDEEEGSQASEKRKAKKKKAAAAAAASAATAASMTSSSLQLSCMGESDSQDSQTSTNTDILDFQDDSFPTVSEVTRRPVSQQSDKAKESTRKIFSGPKRSPTKAVYNARHWNRPEPEELPPPPLSRFHPAPASISTKETTAHKDDGLFKAPPPPPRVIKSVTMPTQPYQYIVTALKCRKEDKELYTVVQHVKHFNDVVEFGENQEFTDDFEYLQTGLKSSQPLNTRCLSIISLASKCAMPSFRMHLRAHGMVAQVFKTLNDAPQHPNLALCTASLMYILSRDRLNMDLDRASLDLMIRLLELEQDSSVAIQLNEKEINKVKEKIRKLCETVHNKHLDLENITSGHLAMETLLSLTSKRAGDWFKEELRLLGGLDHIVDKVKECVENLSHEDDEENLVASLRGAERCLRVLESVSN
ncbi:UNVERIFIED_CONTAM: hypothetical protein FKN15_031709 [Acipenser sinensis]